MQPVRFSPSPFFLTTMSTSTPTQSPRHSDISRLISELSSQTPASPSKNASIIPTQLDTALRLLGHHQTMSPATPPPDQILIQRLVSTAKVPDFHALAKYKDIITKPIKLAYDGITDNFIPFLNWLDIRRQDESWCPATYLKINDHTYNLLHNFTEIDESVILVEANSIWTSPQCSTG
jgi:hypothetical protein